MANRVTTHLTVDCPAEFEDVASKVGGRAEEWFIDFGVLLPEPIELVGDCKDPFHATSEEASRREKLKQWRALYWGCASNARDWDVKGKTISIETNWELPRAWLDSLSQACPGIKLHVVLDASENECPKETFTLLDGVSSPVEITPYVPESERK